MAPTIRQSPASAVPARAPSTDEASTHVVKKGDTLSKIALTHNVPLKELIQANPQLKNPDLIFPGQAIKLPQTGQARAAAPTATAQQVNPSSTDNFGKGGQLPPTAIRARTDGGPDVSKGPVNSLLGQLSANRRSREGGDTTASPQVSTRAPAQGTPQASTAGGSPQVTPSGGPQGAARAPAQGTPQASTGAPPGWESRTNLDRNAGAMDVGVSDYNASTAGVFQTDLGRGSGTSWHGERGGGQISTHSARTEMRGGTTNTETRSRTTVGGEERQSSHGLRESRRDGSGASVGESRRTDAQGRTLQASTSSETEVQDGVARSVERRSASARNQQGQQVDSESETVRYSAQNGEESSQTTRVSQRSDGTTTATTESNHEAGRTRGQELRRKAADFVDRHVDAQATLYSKEVDSGWHGAVVHDRSHREDRTGAGYEVHALAAQGKAGVAATVDLKSGTVRAGAMVEGRVDLIGVSGKAQVGTASSVAGAGYAQGEAHVGARATAGAGVEIDPRKGTAKVVAGVEGFAGAEARGTIGYQNRYVGAEVEARGQAGIGGVARAEVGFDKGTFKLQADLGACVGLGGRIGVNVQVNVGAIYEDSKAAVKDVASKAGTAIASGWNRVKSWF